MKILQKPQYAIFAFLALGLLIVLVIIIVQSLTPKNAGTISENQIKIQKGEKIVIVDKNGLVEYRTGDKVFYQVWDTAKISDFFTQMENLARKYLESPNLDICSVGYTVTLYLDGDEVTVCLEEEEILDEIYQEFGEEDGGGEISELFEDLLDDGLTPSPTSVIPTPVPTTLIVSGEEGGSSGGGGSQQVFECDLFGLQINSRTVISNTVCLLEPSPTLPPLP